MIFRSNKPAAKEFQDWVFNEVLPSIRKTGSYGSDKPQSSMVIAPHPESLPEMVYHHQSKYNPYPAYACNGSKGVYVGCFPKVEDAVEAQKRFLGDEDSKRTQARLFSNEQDMLSVTCMPFT